MSDNSEEAKVNIPTLCFLVVTEATRKMKMKTAVFKKQLPSINDSSSFAEMTKM